MGDRQFSIPNPWSEPGKESWIMVDCYGDGKEYFIDVRGKLVRFEWSDRFGPMPINKGGSECLSIGPKHGFWRAASLWRLQGKRLEGDRAIWHEPRKEILERRGRMLFVVQQGEPGHDW